MIRHQLYDIYKVPAEAAGGGKWKTIPRIRTTNVNFIYDLCHTKKLKDGIEIPNPLNGLNALLIFLQLKYCNGLMSYVTRPYNLTDDDPFTAQIDTFEFLFDEIIPDSTDIRLQQTYYTCRVQKYDNMGHQIDPDNPHGYAYPFENFAQKIDFDTCYNPEIPANTVRIPHSKVWLPRGYSFRIIKHLDGDHKDIQQIVVSTLFEQVFINNIENGKLIDYLTAADLNRQNKAIWTANMTANATGQHQKWQNLVLQENEKVLFFFSINTTKDLSAGPTQYSINNLHDIQYIKMAENDKDFYTRGLYNLISLRSFLQEDTQFQTLCYLLHPYNIKLLDDSNLRRKYTGLDDKNDMSLQTILNEKLQSFIDSDAFIGLLKQSYNISPDEPVLQVGDVAPLRNLYAAYVPQMNEITKYFLACSLYNSKQTQQDGYNTKQQNKYQQQHKMNIIKQICSQNEFFQHSKEQLAIFVIMCCRVVKKYCVVSGVAAQAIPPFDVAELDNLINQI